MSFDPRDYAPTFAIEDRMRRDEEDERREAIAQETEERRAREMAFHETPWCELTCYDTLTHTAGCQAVNEPVTAALNGWRRAVAIAAEPEGGIMATATAINRPPPIELIVGEPQEMALRFVEPKEVRYGLMFGTMDRRPLFLNTDDGNEFEHTLRDMNYRPGEPILVTKIQHGSRGGGFSYRVERPVANHAPQDETQLERDLQRSIDAQRAKTSARKPGPASASASEERAERAPARVTAVAPTSPSERQGSNASLPPNSPTISPASVKLCAAFMAAIDAVSEAQTYADRRNLKITFTSEDVRSTAISCYITACREGGR